MWEEFILKLSSINKDLNYCLQDKASEVMIRNYESYLSLKLPEDLVSIYQTNNGQLVDCVPVLPDGFELLPIDDAKTVWDQLSEVGSTEGDVLWKPSWIPVAQTIGGGLICYVLEDGENRLVRFYPESAKEETLATGFDTYLDAVIQYIEENHMLFDQANNCFVVKK